MPDIFLSYNREDQAQAQLFARAFEAEGYSVWWDVTLRSGEAYDRVTEDALRTAKAVVVLWSERSVVSRWVRAEATLADRNRTLVPARIGPCDLPIMFELTQTADLSHWHGQRSDPTWQSFLKDIRRFVEAPAEPERAPLPMKPSQVRGRSASIAVLPFLNRGGLEEDDLVADGMVDDLTAALSVSRKMRVIASSATANYRTGARDLRQIGQDLGVRYLLEGNLRRVGASLRVSAQLVEAEEGNILWTQKFDRPLEELAELQEELVTEVAAILGVEVQRAEMEHALRKPDDISAWEAVLRAEAHIARNTLAGLEAAVVEARRAVEIDPEYDLAHATFALASALNVIWRGPGHDDLRAEVMAAIARARSFDSSDPIVMARIATASLAVAPPLEALPFAERAVSLNPNLEIPHIALGNVLGRLGRMDEAIGEFEAADRLAPNGVWQHGPSFMRALVHFRSGDVARSLELTEQTLRLRIFLPAQIHRAICFARLGRRDEARIAVRLLREANSQLTCDGAEILLREFCAYGAGDEQMMILRELWEEGAQGVL
jgi:TolB-like protein